MRISYANGELTIRVPVTDEIVNKAPPSSTGKTKVVSSSRGFMALGAPGLPAGLALNLTLTAR